jgi:hypothetical protein
MDILNQHLIYKKGIYKITNKVNGKYYIGMTDISFWIRMLKHLSNLRINKHPNKYLQDSFNKYTESNFVFECYIDMSYFSKDEILAKEESLILEKYNTGALYNTLVGKFVINCSNIGSNPVNRIENLISICQFSKSGEYIKTFNSIADAERETGCDGSSITKMITGRGNKLFIGGFAWRKESECTSKEPIAVREYKIKIRKDCRVCIITNNEIDCVFNTARIASIISKSSYISIRDCINNKRKTCNRGLLWKYYEDCN